MTKHRGFSTSGALNEVTPLPAASSRDVWVSTAATPEFVLLRRRLVRFILPATAVFLAWFLCYLVLNAWYKDLLSARIAGIPVVLLFAFGQFVSTFAMTTAYNRYAERRLDPIAAELRDRLERPC